jgi:uncharacterized membrane protein AbrB (regulator of aidB expression)
LIFAQDIVPIEQVPPAAFLAGLLLGTGLITTVIGIAAKSPKKIFIGVALALLGIAIGIGGDQ